MTWSLEGESMGGKRYSPKIKEEQCPPADQWLITTPAGLHIPITMRLRHTQRADRAQGMRFALKDFFY